MSKITFSQATYRVKRSSLLFTKRLVQGIRPTSQVDTNRLVVFVAGVQRSGTNMMMDTLERSLKTDVYHESDGRAYDAYEMRSRETIRRLISASRASHIVLKALCELHELTDLLDDFAPSRAVWMVRDMADVVNSHLALWTGMPQSIGQIVENPNGAAGWRGRGMSDATHDLLKLLYRPGISNASACALFWYLRNVLFFEKGLDSDERVRPVRYERLVSQPEATFRQLFEFLGLDFSPRLVKLVVSTSVGRRPAPDIDPAVREICAALEAKFERVCPE